MVVCQQSVSMMCCPSGCSVSYCTSPTAGQAVSAWHDVPLHNEDGTLNFICEIPKNTSAKMEVATVSAWWESSSGRTMPRHFVI